jgi:4-amino-4-deoxy-L-arabinose transferase-like glycosyltransferase
MTAVAGLGALAPTVPDGEGMPGSTAGAPGVRPAFERRSVFAVAGLFVALELAMSARYGIHRDELYFLACAHHLAWGYVDQPPFVPFVAWLETSIFGVSATSLRVLPALAGGASVVLAAFMARELGGRRLAQAITAIAAATSAELLAIFHALSTAAFDAFFWSLITWLVLRLCRTGDRRLWLAIGGVTGVALMNKLDAALLVAALVGTMAAARQYRPLLRSWQVLAGAAIALVIFLPDIVWNAGHGWAQLAMLHSLHAENSTLGASLQFVPAQLIVVGPVLALVWIPGLRWSWRDSLGRVAGVAFLLLLAFFVLSGGKTYYIAGGYYALFAAGGVAIEHRVARRGSRPARSLARWAAVLALGALPTLPLVLPVLPASTLPRGSWEGSINKDLSATYGWPSFVRQIALLADRLPAPQRARLVIFTGDYGAAGAIDLYGPAYRLPQAISGHNNFWWWGPAPAPDDSTTIAVNLPAAYLRTIFASVRPIGSVATPHGAWTEERGDPIYLCTHQVESWAEAWPGARHYG